jgi:hypothetical protein
MSQSQSPMMEHNGFQMSPTSAPPLMNPPPQIFGAYSADGMPIPPTLSDVGGPMFADGALLDESNEAKRRRIARVEYLTAKGGTLH